jgi:hypothetical protein
MEQYEINISRIIQHVLRVKSCEAFCNNQVETFDHWGRPKKGPMNSLDFFAFMLVVQFVNAIPHNQ